MDRITRFHVQALVSAPSKYERNLSKTNLRSKDVYLMGVMWETLDSICSNPKCGHVKSKYGNYVTDLRDVVDALLDDKAPPNKAREMALALKQRWEKP